LEALSAEANLRALSFVRALGTRLGGNRCHRMSGPQNNFKQLSPQAYAWAGYVGLGGCVAAVAGDSASVALRDGMSLIADSISRTAAGEHSIMVDAGLCFFALGILGIARALHHWKLDGKAYRFGTISLALCAASIFFLAVWDGYDPDAADDLGLHMMLLYAMSVLFPLSLLLLASGLGEVHRNWKLFCWAVVALWIIAGPIYYLNPDHLKGLFERVTMSLIVIWVAAISVLLIRRSGRAAVASVHDERWRAAKR